MPLEYTMAVAGCRSGQKVVLLSFTFSPTVQKAVMANMTKITLTSTFVKLDNVTIIHGDLVLKGLSLDDINVVFD